MGLRIALTVLLTASSISYASSENEGPTSNIIRTILNSIYLGNVTNTDQTMVDLAFSYRVFLDDFVNEPFCKNERRKGLEDACLNFRDEENKKIAKSGKWSSPYQFHKSEVGTRITTYNFVRVLPLVDDFFCKITLQVYFDLKQQRLVNREYGARCD